MFLYNTMTRQREVFQPSGNPVSLYVCGVTPYDTTHLGHARTYLVFDVLHRYLTHLGMSVRYVQNVTDVDDPLLARANELGLDYRDLAEQYIEIFLADLQKLNVLMPTVYPRATEEIPAMLEAIRTLIDRAMAYPRGGSVYFRASRAPLYGAMGRLDRAAMLAAHRESGENPDDPNKEDPLDFRLWQAAQPGEPVWSSPWGPGRPGWHIECSAIANRYLGTVIDIHGGGEDLIFPHHCSEAAQSESASGQAPFARHWVHVGLVWMDGEKMSKSRGNMAFVRDLLPIYGPDVLRYYLLSFPYRDRLEYLEGDLAGAAQRWRGIAQATPGPIQGPETPTGGELREQALRSLDDDLDTSGALARIDELADLVCRAGQPGDRGALRSLLGVLGFRADGSVTAASGQARGTQRR